MRPTISTHATVVYLANKLKNAFDKISTLSEKEQDAIAEALLAVVDDTWGPEDDKDEAQWDALSGIKKISCLVGQNGKASSAGYSRGKSGSHPQRHEHSSVVVLPHLKVKRCFTMVKIYPYLPCRVFQCLHNRFEEVVIEIDAE